MLRNFVKRIYGLYDVKDLIVGGHCGLCGAWMPDTIVEKACGWGMCDKCAKAEDPDRVTLCGIPVSKEIL